MSERLPEPTVFKDSGENSYLNQLVRILRNNFTDIEKGLELSGAANFFINITTSTRSPSHNGFWILSNAQYNSKTDEFFRIDETKTSFGINVRGIDTIPFEANTYGVIFWKAVAGANPISNTYGSVGGWENMLLLTEFKDIVIGGYGLEIDGNGFQPFGRLALSPLSGDTFFGLLTNAFNDYSGFDDNTDPSWRVAVDLTNDEFNVSRAPANTNTFVDFLKVGSAGEVSLNTSPSFTDKSTRVATTTNVNHKKEVWCQINNVGGALNIVTQVDGMANDAIASVNHAATGIVTVTFKSGFFNSTPVVIASPYGSVNNNWICSVNSTSTTSTTIYTFDSGTTLVDFHFTLGAFGI